MTWCRPKLNCCEQQKLLFRSHSGRGFFHLFARTVQSVCQTCRPDWWRAFFANIHMTWYFQTISCSEEQKLHFHSHSDRGLFHRLLCLTLSAYRNGRLVCTFWCFAGSHMTWYFLPLSCREKRKLYFRSRSGKGIFHLFARPTQSVCRNGHPVLRGTFANNRRIWFCLTISFREKRKLYFHSRSGMWLWSCPEK